MFCPRCGSMQSDELKFCKSCGANLHAVRRAVDTQQTHKKHDRNKPWFAEMAMHEAESKRRQAELDHRRGIGPEVTRHNEIKAGIITGSVGLSVAIFLYVFMQGLIASGNVSASTAEILSRIWVAGLIPLLVGLALLLNGLFVSKKLAEVVRRAAQAASADTETNPLELPSVETPGFVPADYSVTEDTTKHLKSH